LFSGKRKGNRIESRLKISGSGEHRVLED